MSATENVTTTLTCDLCGRTQDFLGDIDDAWITAFLFGWMEVGTLDGCPDHALSTTRDEVHDA